MTTPAQPTKQERELAREIVPCPHPVGLATCPFHWNSCRRTETCELRQDFAQALASYKGAVLGEAARVVCDHCETEHPLSDDGRWHHVGPCLIQCASYHIRALIAKGGEG